MASPCFFKKGALYVYHLEFVLLKLIPQPLQVSQNDEIQEGLDLPLVTAASLTLLCHSAIVHGFSIASTTGMVSDCGCPKHLSEMLCRAFALSMWVPD